MRVASKPFSVYTSCVVWALPAFCQMKAHAHTGTGIQMGFLSLKMARNYLYNSSLSSIHSTVQGVLSGSAWLFHARSFPVFECEHVSDTEFPEKLSIFLKWIFCAIALSSHLESCSGWDLLYPPHILQMELNEPWSFPESTTDETEMLQSPEITQLSLPSCLIHYDELEVLAAHWWKYWLYVRIHSSSGERSVRGYSKVSTRCY